MKFTISYGQGEAGLSSPSAVALNSSAKCDQAGQESFLAG